MSRPEPEARGAAAYDPVSYTHLDVYKRQLILRTQPHCRSKIKRPACRSVGVITTAVSYTHLDVYKRQLIDGGLTLVFSFTDEAGQERIPTLLRDVSLAGLNFRDLQTQQTSLEDIFVSLVKER